MSGAPSAVELTLYVWSGDPASSRAKEGLRVVVGQLSARALRVELCDVARDQDRMRKDRVAHVPLLRIRIGDEPAVWVSDFARDSLVEQFRALGLLPD